MRTSRAKPLLAYSVATGEVERYPSIKAASRAGHNPRDIWMCDKGRRRTHHRRRWLVLAP